MDSTAPQNAEAELPKQPALNGNDQSEEPPAKKARLEESAPSEQQNGNGQTSDSRKRGEAPVKAEYAPNEIFALTQHHD